LPRLLGIDRHWGVAGLTLSAGIAGWVEFALLRRALQARIGAVIYSSARVGRLWAAALLSAAVAYGCKFVLHFRYPWVGLCLLAIFGVCYLAATSVLGVEAPARVSRLLRIR
jgi:putative peptidoglycan lipid II flippase